jgi:hypothetical protein
MHTRLVITLLIGAAIAFACGPRSHSSEVPARKPAADSTDGKPIATSLDVQVNDEVHFAFHLTNNDDDRLELVFPSGQTHDIVVRDSAGREVWRWSSGRMFTQSLQNRVLEPSETVSYSVRWKPASLTGKFVAEALLASNSHPVRQRVEFMLP